VSTTIAFLEGLREDLLDAGWRESLPAGHRVRGGRRFGGKKWLVAVAAVFGLLAVTGVGLLATGHGPQIRAQLALPREASGDALVPSAPAPADREKSIFSVSQQGAHTSLEFAPPSSVGDQAARGPVALRDVDVGDLALIIKSGRLSIVIERDTFATRMQDAMDVAKSNGGYVQSTTTQGSRFGSLVIRVPSDRFETTIRELKELGTRVEAQTISGDDVTAEFVDLKARLRIANSRRAVLERLMNKAVSIEQTIRVQNALDEVQLRIEEYQGSLNVLENRVSEATIRLQIREPGVQPFEKDVPNPSVSGALDRAVAGFFSVIAGTVVGLGYAVPLLVIGVALFFGVRFARRRLA
jgi:Domain of unknown function (DUF4349)